MPTPPRSVTNEKVIQADGPVRVTVRRQAGPETVQLLQQTVYGTSGPRYQHTGQDQKVHEIVGAHYFEAWTGTQLAGTYCLSERTVRTAAGPLTGFYGRYLSVHPDYGGQGYGRLLKRKAVAYITGITPQPHVFYSYIEEANGRSMRLSAGEGFADLATLEALLFSRPYPKANPRVSRLPADRYPDMRQRLESTYEPYTLVQFERLFYGGHYFVLEAGGEIVAGVQANPVRWRIVGMPGLSGKLIMRVAPHLPVLGRLINPDRYAFAALEALYVQPGREAALLTLLEGVLADLGCTSALLMADVHAPVAGWLKRSGKLGIMNALKKNIFTKVMAKANGLAPDEIKAFPAQPVYTSAFDYT
jgi:GNAT superfamily N-acetyltransferase